MEKIFFCDPAMEKNIIYIQGAKIFFQSISGPLHIHGRVIRFCLNLNAAVWNIVWNDEYFTQMPLLIQSTWNQNYRCANKIDAKVLPFDATIIQSLTIDCQNALIWYHFINFPLQFTVLFSTFLEIDPWMKKPCCKYQILCVIFSQFSCTSQPWSDLWMEIVTREAKKSPPSSYHHPLDL